MTQPARTEIRVFDVGEVNNHALVFDFLRDADVGVGKALVDLFEQFVELGLCNEETRSGAVDIGEDVVEVPVAVLDLVGVEDGCRERLRPLLGDELVRKFADGGEGSKCQIARGGFTAARVEGEVNATGSYVLLAGFVRWWAIAFDLDLVGWRVPPAVNEVSMSDGV